MLCLIEALADGGGRSRLKVAAAYSRVITKGVFISKSRTGYLDEVATDLVLGGRNAQLGLELRQDVLHPTAAAESLFVFRVVRWQAHARTLG